MISSYPTGRLGGFTNISFSRLRHHMWHYCCAICEHLCFLQSPPGTGYFPAAASLCQISSSGTVTGRYLQLQNTRISEHSCPVSPHPSIHPVHSTTGVFNRCVWPDSNPTFQKTHLSIFPQTQQELTMIDTAVRV